MVRELADVSSGPAGATPMSSSRTYRDQYTAPPVNNVLAATTVGFRLTLVFLLRHRSQLLWTRCAFAARVEVVLGGRGAVISAMATDELPGVFVAGWGGAQGELIRQNRDKCKMGVGEGRQVPLWDYENNRMPDNLAGDLLESLDL